jgi:hypothetical protein
VRSFGGFGPNNYAYLTYAQGEDYYHNLQGLHNGVDFGMPVGTPLCALDWGVVAHVSLKEDDNPYAAGPFTVIIRYGDHVALYGHMKGCEHGKDVFVREGDVVAPGQTIGLSGTSNNSPHLHFEMRKIARAYVNQLRREAEAFTQDPLEQLRHMQAHFHLRGWNPTQTYYVNPAPFFDPPLERYAERYGWRNACTLDADRDGNGYPDQVLLVGQQEPEAYHLYSLRAMPAWGPHFWKGSTNLMTTHGPAGVSMAAAHLPMRGQEDKPDWHYVG